MYYPPFILDNLKKKKNWPYIKIWIILKKLKGKKSDENIFDPANSTSLHKVKPEMKQVAQKVIHRFTFRMKASWNSETILKSTNLWSLDENMLRKVETSGSWRYLHLETSK